MNVFFITLGLIEAKGSFPFDSETPDSLARWRQKSQMCSNVTNTQAQHISRNFNNYLFIFTLLKRLLRMWLWHKERYGKKKMCTYCMSRLKSFFMLRMTNEGHYLSNIDASKHKSASFWQVIVRRQLATHVHTQKELLLNSNAISETFEWLRRLHSGVVFASVASQQGFRFKPEFTKVFLCGVCMLCLCMCRFPLGTPVFCLL